MTDNAESRDAIASKYRNIFIPVLKNETFCSIEMSQQCVTTWKRRNSEERLGVVQGGDVVVDGEGGVGLKYFWS